MFKELSLPYPVIFVRSLVFHYLQFSLEQFDFNSKYFTFPLEIES
jgi:hypothetical protein